jgi:hypothetical protein
MYTKVRFRLLTGGQRTAVSLRPIMRRMAGVAHQVPFNFNISRGLRLPREQESGRLMAATAADRFGESPVALRFCIPQVWVAVTRRAVAIAAYFSKAG